MPHYRNGQPAAIGDTVKGLGYNVKGPDGQLAEIIGKVVSITPGADSCNISVAYIEVLEVKPPEPCGVYEPKGVAMWCPDGKTRVAIARLEYGQADHFEKIG